MVIHYPPERLRSNSDRPSAITDVLVTTTGSSSTGEDLAGRPDLLGPHTPRPLGAVSQW